MQKILLALLAFFVFTTSFAQMPASATKSTYAIHGTVLDSVDQSLLAYATIALIEAGNKESIKTTITDLNGFFSLSALPDKSHTLVISYLGYHTKTIQLAPLTTPTLALGQIKLVPALQQLQEVMVTAQRLLIEQDLDKLTYHAELDPEYHSLTALELLGKVPMLSLDGNNMLQLNGSDSYQVLINGKTSSLFVQNPSEVLQTMPASTIKSIEVITNPPARYDAEGIGGIINIITHRKAISGYNGSLNLGLSSPQGATGGVNLTAKWGKFGFSGQGGHTYSTNPTASRNAVREDYIRQTRLAQTGESNSRNSSRYGGGEFSYELNALNLLTASYRINASQGGNDFSQQVALFNDTNVLAQAYQNLSKGRNSSLSSDLSLDYQRSFRKSPDQLFTISYRQSTNAQENFSEFALQPLLNYWERLSQTENENGTREHVLQADWVQPIKKQTLELGVKSSLRHNSSDYHISNYQQESDSYIPDPLLSNNFEYQQDIHAAYASLNLKKGRWGLRTGVRLEETRVDANFRSSGTIAAQRYQNLIPNLNLTHKFKGNSSLRFSYTQRLERPGLYHLNPYVHLLDPRNISYGNPELEPATNHSFNLAYATYRKQTSFNAGFFNHFTNNSIQRITTLGEDTVARTTFANIGQRQTWGLTLNGNTLFFKKLNLNLNSSTQYFHLRSISGDRPQQNAGITLNASGNLSYRFNKSWRASGSVAYSSPQILLQGRSAGFVSNNLALNKDFLKNNKGNLSLSVRNPFQKYRRFQSEVNDPAFYQLQESYSVIRQYSLAFNYRFGKVQAGSSRKKRSLQHDDSRVTE